MPQSNQPDSASPVLPDPRRAASVAPARFLPLVRDVSDYAMCLLDPQGHIETWNAGAQAAYGYTAAQIKDSALSRLYRPEDITAGLPDQELRTAGAAGRSRREGWQLRHDGTSFWATTALTAVYDEKGRLGGFVQITSDLTEQRQREQSLRDSEGHFRRLVEGVRDYAIFSLDPRGYVTSWNAGARHIKGYEADEIIGSHVSRLYPPDQILANLPWQDLAAAREQGSLRRDGWCVRKDGSRFWGRTLLTRLLDAQGRLLGYAHLTQDLTQQRHSEALEDTAQRMHEFIAMLGHELRNPLAPIRNAVSLMERKGLGDPVLESMRATIARQIDLLSHIVDELLDVNRIVRGQLTLEKTTLDLVQIVTRALEVNRPEIERRRHTLALALPEQPVTVQGDALRLTQVVVNLLNNAAKYTPPGGRISCSLVAVDANVELHVRDSGVGIGAEALPHLFDLFYQGADASEPAERGLGVGLALVRQIVELHGGYVRAVSAGAGLGSEFVATLPAAAAAVAAAAGAQVLLAHEAAVAPAAETPPSLRIVVADDNVDAATSFGFLLESFGQEVRLAFDGRAAVAAVEQMHPHVVMLDIGMPILDGYEVARRLRAGQDGSRLLLVAITGWGQEADRERTQQAGFDFHFVKPVSQAELQRVLLHARRLLNDGADRGASAVPGASVGPAGLH